MESEWPERCKKYMSSRGLENREGHEMEGEWERPASARALLPGAEGFFWRGTTSVLWMWCQIWIAQILA